MKTRKQKRLEKQQVKTPDLPLPTIQFTTHVTIQPRDILDYIEGEHLEALVIKILRFPQCGLAVALEDIKKTALKFDDEDSISDEFEKTVVDNEYELEDLYTKLEAFDNSICEVPLAEHIQIDLLHGFLRSILSNEIFEEELVPVVDHWIAHIKDPSKR